MGTQKFEFFFQKSLKFEFWLVLKSWNHLSFVNISPTLVNDTSIQRSSRVLHHGNLIFFKSLKFEFWLMTKRWNHLSFVNVTPTMVIDTSMERSLRVLQHWNLKSWFFFSKKFEIDEIEFCPYPEKRNRLGFVDICPTLVIDTSMERSLRVLQHWIPKSWFFSKEF